METAVRTLPGAERNVNVDMHQNEMRLTPVRGGIGTALLKAVSSAFLKVIKLSELH